MYLDPLTRPSPGDFENGRPPTSTFTFTEIAPTQFVVTGRTYEALRVRADWKLPKYTRKVVFVVLRGIPYVARFAELEIDGVNHHKLSLFERRIEQSAH